jgi:4-hydroxy-tetrahydrodipicolinate reductase
MKTRIILIGCNGAMGKTVTQQAEENESLDIVAGVDKNSGTTEYPVYDTLEKIIEEADVIIDFSSREMLKSLLDYAKARSLPAVLCATGYTEQDKLAVIEASETIPIFRSENMSYGMNVVVALLKKAAELLEEGFDIEVIEKHHNQKKDAPSGTANMIVRAINGTLTRQCDVVHGRSGYDAKRQNHEIGVHAIRGGTIPGEHTVIFAGQDEIIEIKHTALSKKIFATGALRAAAYIVGKGPGMTSMDEMLKS